MAKKTNSVIRVALIGPECSGKTTLATKLAAYFNTLWVEEYAVEYLQTLITPYRIKDILQISKTQLKLEKEYIKKANKFIFVDTELIVSKVWCDDVFNKCPAWIEKGILKNKYDLYLLTSPDIKWKKGIFRENPTRRKYLFSIYETELKRINARYVIIKGKGKMRFANCLKALRKIAE